MRALPGRWELESGIFRFLILIAVALPPSFLSVCLNARRRVLYGIRKTVTSLVTSSHESLTTLSATWTKVFDTMSTETSFDRISAIDAAFCQCLEGACKTRRHGSKAVAMVQIQSKAIIDAIWSGNSIFLVDMGLCTTVRMYPPWHYPSFWIYPPFEE
jgi:hypothetical protein